MWLWIVRRLARLTLAVWLIVSIAFLLVYALPGDPARLVLGQRASAETLEQFRSAAGLDQPLVHQYARFLERSMRLDFGESLVQRRPVRDLIAERSQDTLTLAFVAMVLVFVFAFVLPVVAAVWYPTKTPQGMSRLWGAFAAMPPYVLAVVLLMLFGAALRWVPMLFNPDSPLSWLLPALVLATYPISIVLKLFQQELALAPAQLYAIRARAYGFSPREILIAETLPNVLTPSLAAFANSLAFFVTGTFFVEVVFGITGLGGLTYEAIRNKDLPLLVGLCVVFAVAVTLISVLLDLAITIINPHMRQRHA